MRNDDAAGREEIRRKFQQEYSGEKILIPAKQKINPFEKSETQRVCAYCRVSTDNIEQLPSFELQQRHYRELAKQHPNWDLRMIYADEGISGTSLKNREQFNRMIADCEGGLYDLIVTKSVSRFARNVVDCVSLVRRLKNLVSPVGVFFETNGLYTLSEKSEMYLTMLATFAQEESVNKSESMNWSLMQRLKNGNLLTPALLGYDRDSEGCLSINESEAVTVRFIFGSFLAGSTIKQIADVLTDVGRPTKIGETAWSEGSIHYILKNERYCGNVLTWKTFTYDVFEHRKRRNRQDRDQYLYQGTHEAIVSMEEFEAVQDLLENHRHHMRGGVPTMHVIDEGVFRGYVPVNHHWISHNANAYYFASRDAGCEKELPRQVKKNAFSRFDLKGYQVVRGLFLTTVSSGPALSVSEKRITFNIGCSRKFLNVPCIQLLLHPVHRKLAIRPCKASDPFSISWRASPDSPLASKTFLCRHFAAALFEIMEWNPDYTYRIRGVWAARGREEIIVFDLSEAAASFVCSEDNSAIRHKKRVVTFPEAWKSEFGQEFYQYVMNYRFRHVGAHTDWKAECDCRPVEAGKSFDVMSEADMQSVLEGWRMD